MSRPHSLQVLAFGVLATGSLFLASCKEDPVTTNPPEIPTTYEFATMNYGTSTVQLLLADSLLTRIKQVDDPGASAIAKSEMESIFDNTSGLFSDIAAGKLSDNISTTLNANLRTQLRDWMDSIATRSQTMAGSIDALTTDDGTYLVEAIEKSLMGSVFYANAVNTLRSANPNAQAWDNAFGYFGASRNYATLPYYSQRRGMLDANNDGEIDPGAERNFFFARYAATADTQYSTYTTNVLNLGNAIVNNFISGRVAIGKGDGAKVSVAANAILTAWDKVIAGNAVRYGGVIKTQIAGGKSYNGQYAELKGFVDMTQYNSTSLLSPAKYAEIKTLIGNKHADVTPGKIDQIVSIIKSAYSF